MIARLILVPVGICVAAAGAFFVLLLESVFNAGLASLVGDLLWRVADLVANAAAGDDVDSERIALLVGATWKLAASVIFAPTLVVAVITEVMGLRSYLLQAVASTLLTMALPFALLPKTLSVAGLPSPILTALGIAGLCAGTLYWFIAGRGAGRSRRPANPPVLDNGPH